MTRQRPSARDEILKLLKTRTAATAQSLAAALGISHVAVRKHLEVLAREGLVTATPRKVPRGRPTYVYSLTETAKAYFPQAYRELALGILDGLSSLAADQGADLLRTLFRSHNQRLGQLYQLRLASKPDLVSKIRELAQARDEEGYMTTLEQDGDAIVLKEHNCPIYAVAQRHPAACECEAELLQGLLGMPVARRARLVDGDAACTYVIEPTGK